MHRSLGADIFEGIDLLIPILTCSSS
jgi:hypothetical protein